MGRRPHVPPGEWPSRSTRSRIGADFEQGREEAALNTNGIYYDSNNQIQDVTMLDTADDVTQTIREDRSRVQPLQPTGLTRWLSGTPHPGRTRHQAQTDARRSTKRSRIRNQQQTKRGRGTMEAGTLHGYLLGAERPRQPKTPRGQEKGNNRWGTIDQDKSALAFRIAVENVNSLPP